MTVNNIIYLDKVRKKKKEEEWREFLGDDLYNQFYEVFEFKIDKDENKL